MSEQQLLSSGRKARVLIVEDENDILDTLAGHYILKGYEVLKAANGKQALEILGQKTVEVVISDIKMPEMDGIDLLREIRQSHPMVRVIMITGYITLDNVLAAFRLGAQKIFYKPLKDYMEIDKTVEDSIANLLDWQKKMKELKHLE